MQLAAGDEHVIEGKTVRVNRAGPRPAPHIGVTSAANRQPAQCDTSAPLPSGISRQRGGHAVPALLGSTSVLSGSQHLAALAPLNNPSRNLLTHSPVCKLSGTWLDHADVTASNACSQPKRLPQAESDVVVACQLAYQS